MKTLEKKPFNRLNSHPKKILFCFIVIFLITIPILNVNAQTEALNKARGGLINSAKKAELASTEATVDDPMAANPQKIITNIVGYILSFIGVILLINMAFAGYSWMSSGGNEESIKKAKDKIKNSIIGLIIIVAAYIITDLIFGSLGSLISGS